MKKVIRLLSLILCAVLLSGCCIKHEWEAATCEDPITCSKCGEVSGEEIGHHPGNWERVSVPLWGQAGVSRRSCVICGQVMEEKTEEAASLYADNNIVMDIYGIKDRMEAVLGTFSADYSCRFIASRNGLQIAVSKGDFEVGSLRAHAEGIRSLVWDTDSMWNISAASIYGMSMEKEELDEAVFREFVLAMIGVADPLCTREEAEALADQIVATVSHNDDYNSDTLEGNTVSISVGSTNNICSFGFTEKD